MLSSWVAKLCLIDVEFFECALTHSGIIIIFFILKDFPEWLSQELIQQMANVQYTENLTEEQLDAMAGSDTLRYQATSFGMTRNNKVHIVQLSSIQLIQ